MQSESQQRQLPTGVIVAATPLGNVADASPRLAAALEFADVIAAEDTRRTSALAAALDVRPRGRILSNFDHNEVGRVRQLLDVARTGTVVVVSDAGMPSVSDPGFPLVDAAHDAGIPVTCFPGPSAVPTALALSGIPVGRFCFEGFAPRKHGARVAWLEELVAERRAVCFFESPHRLAQTLADAAVVLGGARRAAVCRELTKTYEEVRRGTLDELAEWADGGVRGEISVVIEGARPVTRDVADLVEEAEGRAASGERLKTVCAELAAAHGVSKKQIYDGVVALRD
ncbi:16S rRNA (cytidine(1402)-2'-O)-methyltransferase [Corynebacterium pygosceleis]|uniref:Ribosomal RNA small subunit methyltransferase I n=1 Tax=Corynebacterium pygosceleis TaxID=2800406 RepID=A0A9Q4C9J7_9CORY|nr:16S rRNA (cytidine(1402)-2'-O)-methyltransferase [Corynebacterium pygosceleis]MCK7638110.1 16S rRNA (cytidine(1402)-2'-O)-methyltransferase [Corynebacterium pygosceleis]MCK7675824.1 16S rRNA (cytidine(1402)-2'-O)-methyltransferase [Corynebacterium pygosceleis]MCL0120794.1 16S rRNA (cytidine(1402)-2'-O)-methyltransferase [Corynebacterium pygosceleis]MCX7444335.1 16S rRNA (cytidine(1402)-2'-O)-methyltransferase [Corynebacterium pygosceleis]MCX7468826.1 16S rRNA (cytidine(1402)-2'-O)-methyltra